MYNVSNVPVRSPLRRFAVICILQNNGSRNRGEYIVQNITATVIINASININTEKRRLNKGPEIKD